MMQSEQLSFESARLGAHRPGRRHPESAVDDGAFVGAIPERFHRDLGPVLFEPYARLTAERIRARAPRRVLETACGTGIVTRRLREVLHNDALLVASDLHEPMLAVARAALGSEAAVEWSQADMCELRFGDRAFDAVVCQFGLMFVADKLAAVREAHRVLEPGGSLLLTTWAPLDRNAVISVAHHTVGLVFAENPPQHLVRAPFGHGDPRELHDLLVAGGFRDVEVDVVEKSTSAPSAHELAAGLLEGTPLGDEIRLRDAARLPSVIGAVARAIGRRFGDRPVKGQIAALVASAVA
jgi:ubiquinone/menaquinone biosynthesis C-methylase UbiE